jgi:peptidyl-prolyl cis-trans isomerase D
VIQQADIERHAREYQLAIALGLTDFVRELGGFSENEEAALSEFILNSLVIQHEAEHLNIAPNEESIAAEISSLPAFQTEGSFDSAKYQTFMKEQLAPRGFTERHLEEMIGELLSYRKLHQLIVSPIAVSEAQVRDAARIYQSVTVDMIRFSKDAYLKDIKPVSLEEKKAFYEKNKTAFMTEEKRSVSYFVFSLPPAAEKLQGKERVHALQQVATAATAFKKKSEEGLKAGKNLALIAKQNGKTVTTTGFFNRRGESNEESVSSKQQKETTPKVPDLVVASGFNLAQEKDVSEVIPAGTAFYLVVLEKKNPSHQRTFAESEAKIDAFLRGQQAEKLMKEAAYNALIDVRKSLKEGKTFAQAAASTHHTAEVLANLSAQDKKASTDQRLIFQATLTLNEKELSEVKHAAWGDFILYLEHRAPLTNADWEAHRAGIEQEFLEQEQNMIFAQWLTKARADAKVTMLHQRGRKR